MFSYRMKLTLQHTHVKNNIRTDCGNKKWLAVVHSNITYQHDLYDLLGYREVVTNELR